MEVAEKEQEFEKLEADFQATRDQFKENKKALQEITKERNKRID